MTDKATRLMIENGFKTGAIESPEMIMQERIRLRITPNIVRYLFREAYKRYEFRRKYENKVLDTSTAQEGKMEAKP